MKTKFEVTDLTLPLLELPDPCPIRVEMRNDSLHLYVGPRDWQWDLENGELVGCGTRLADDAVENFAKNSIQ